MHREGQPRVRAVRVEMKRALYTPLGYWFIRSAMRMTGYDPYNTADYFRIS